MRIIKKKKFELLNRRLFIFGAFKVLSITFILERLYNMQIKQSEKYKKLAENNRINNMFVLPSRGIIYDRNDYILAENKEQYQLIYRYEKTNTNINHIKKIFEYLDVESEKKQKLVLTVKKNKSDFLQLVVKNNLSWNEVAKISSNITELKGVFIEMIFVRYYPSLPTSHIVGYVKKPDKENYPKLAKVPGTVIGKVGIEKSFDKRLQGKFGLKKEEVNAHGRVVKEISRVNGIAGEDIKLSISSNLQEFCYNRLGDNTGSIVTLNVNNGELLSLVSKPSFNSNDFIKQMSKEKWNEISSNKFNPMFDRACLGTYPPGSIFKLIVSIVALNEEDFNPKKKFFCNGGYKFGNQIFHCWKEGGHGYVNCEEAISMSCDCYFYDLSLNIGIKKIASMAYSFGLGKNFLNEFFPTSSGTVPDRDWKKNKFNLAWTRSDTIVASIGQGYVLSTPLQLAVMVARIATDGNNVVSTIIKQDLKQKPFTKAVSLNNKIFDIIKKSMYNTVNNDSGTAFASRLINSNFKMSGKTATSQVRRISMSEREEGIKKNEELPREQRDHALFAGYYPHINPKYAFSVVVEHGGSGSKSAAPIARDLCKKLSVYTNEA